MYCYKKRIANTKITIECNTCKSYSFKIFFEKSYDLQRKINDLFFVVGGSCVYIVNHT